MAIRQQPNQIQWSNLPANYVTGIPITNYAPAVQAQPAWTNPNPVSVTNAVSTPAVGNSWWDNVKEGFSNIMGTNPASRVTEYDGFYNEFLKAKGIDPTKVTEAQQMQANAFAQSMMKNQVTGLDWANFGLTAVSNLYGMHQAHKNYKLNKANFEEQKALNRADYMNQAKAYNNTLRNQQSGRSFEGMSGASTRELGREYNTRRANESY